MCSTCTALPRLVPRCRDVPPALVIGRQYVTERDSAPVQYNGIVYHSRYWYTKVWWLTRFDQSEPVAHPYLHLLVHTRQSPRHDVVYNCHALHMHIEAVYQTLGAPPATGSDFVTVRSLSACGVPRVKLIGEYVNVPVHYDN